MADTIVMRSVRWLVERQRERLAKLDALADLAPFRETVARVRELDHLGPKLTEAVELLEAEIRERERIQERARAVLTEAF